MLQVVVIILAALFFYIAPPVAWEAKCVPNRSFHTIPEKTFYARSWYVPPHKKLRRYKESLAEISRKQNSYKKIRPSIDALKSASRRIIKSVEASQKNRHLNRNSSNFCFDDTRSCRDIDGFYVNANDVETALQNYMVCQGPLEKTIGDFWKAVLHKQSDCIVTLVMATENNKAKCASYWTIPEYHLEGWTITLEREKLLATSHYIPSHRVVERLFLAKNGTQERKIRHIHYENWPDGKAPEFELFVKLLDIVDEGCPTGPITVHCSAGIGRSGTFVAAHSLRKEIRNSPNRKVQINIPKAIYLLRCQRAGLVSSSGQHKTIYKTLAQEYTPRAHPFFILSAPSFSP